jgi:hypothetical protein
VFPKVRALLGDYFILQSSWCTVVPPGFPGGGFHQDGSGAYEFRRLATPTPLVQLRIGFFLTDQSDEDMGNMAMIPGSHNSAAPLPADPKSLLPIREVIRGTPGTALMFHQGVFHNGGPNKKDFERYIMHMVYAPPWLIRSDRMRNSPEFLARTTPLRRALMGEWEFPEQPFGGDTRSRRSTIRSRRRSGVVAAVDVGGRVGRFDRRERLKDLVGMGGALGHHPGVAGFEQDHLALGVQLRAPRDDVADRFVVARDRFFGLAWGRVLP